MWHGSTVYNMSLNWFTEINELVGLIPICSDAGSSFFLHLLSLIGVIAGVGDYVNSVIKLAEGTFINVSCDLVTINLT